MIIILLPSFLLFLRLVSLQKGCHEGRSKRSKRRPELPLLISQGRKLSSHPWFRQDEVLPASNKSDNDKHTLRKKGTAIVGTELSDSTAPYVNNSTCLCHYSPVSAKCNAVTKRTAIARTNFGQNNGYFLSQ